jgi:hypothetical protein
MYKWMSLATIIIFTYQAWANPAAEESLYNQFQKNIRSQNSIMKSSVGFSPFEQSLFVDALWDMADENEQSAINFLASDAPVYYELAQKLRVGILRIKYNQAPVLPIQLENEIINALQAPVVEIKIIYLIAAYEKELAIANHHEIIKLAKTHPQYYDVVDDQEIVRDISDNMLIDLFHLTPDITTYMNGEYINSVKLFMFCRSNRLYPCLMVMKNNRGQAVRLQDGTLWSNPELASSARGLPSYSRNGNTPQGVHTIDSVMRLADAQTSFGKFRRMILNFIPKSRDEVLTKALLPPSSQKSDWWKSAVVSRDIGRNLLRIHGTGKINIDKETPYYPFMRTNGCIAQRENTYDGVTFNDQRNLLDSIMSALDLELKYSNETQIKGILYLVDIDDENSPVTLLDLAIKGIE